MDGAITRLGELGMLDDAAFAAAWVESRDRASPRGERALRQELSLRGVDRGVVDGVLADRRGADDDAPDGDPDTDAAMRLLAKRASSLSRIIDPRERRQRAYALLARNGFDPSTAMEVARRWVNGDAADLDGTA